MDVNESMYVRNRDSNSNSNSDSNNRARLEAFYTLEASFIIPAVFMIFILIIYFTFFLYNHCVVSQAVYIAALRGQQIRNTDCGHIETEVSKQLNKLLDEQVYQYGKGHSVDVTETYISVKAESTIINRMSKFGIYNRTGFTSKGECTISQFYPGKYIRSSHKGR